MNRKDRRPTRVVKPSSDMQAVPPADAPRTRPPGSNEFSEGRKGVDHDGPVNVSPADFQPIETQPAASTEQPAGSDD